MYTILIKNLFLKFKMRTLFNLQFTKEDELKAFYIYFFSLVHDLPLSSDWASPNANGSKLDIVSAYFRIEIGPVCICKMCLGMCT